MHVSRYSLVLVIAVPPFCTYMYVSQYTVFLTNGCKVYVSPPSSAFVRNAIKLKNFVSTVFPICVFTSIFVFTFTVVLHWQRCISIGADVTSNTASRARVHVSCVLLDFAWFYKVFAKYSHCEQSEVMVLF